jgi:hypothetical protein
LLKRVTLCVHTIWESNTMICVLYLPCNNQHQIKLNFAGLRIWDSLRSW